MAVSSSNDKDESAMLQVPGVAVAQAAAVVGGNIEESAALRPDDEANPPTAHPSMRHGQPQSQRSVLTSITTSPLTC